MQSLNFIFDGISSQDMGVVLVNTGSGMLKTPFMSSQEIVSENIVGRDAPIYYNRNKKPLEVTLTLACLTTNFWTFEKRREIARWLSGNSDKGKFCEFYTTDDIDFADKRWFLIYQGGIDFTHNSMNEGYIEINMLSETPYTYSPVVQQNYDFSTIGTTTTNFSFMNLGDISLLPEFLEITKVGSGNLSIKNNSNGGREFKFTGLIGGEILTIDNVNRDISTSLNATYRYNAHNGVYLKFVYGNNSMQITGACKIKIKYRHIFLG